MPISTARVTKDDFLNGGSVLENLRMQIIELLEVTIHGLKAIDKLKQEFLKYLQILGP
jgi:hypothetical protein